MAEIPKDEAPLGWSQRTRSRLTDAGTAVRRTLARRRGGPEVAEKRAPETALAVDEVRGSPTDLADADITVQRAWTHARLAVLISVIVAQAVLALIVWRIRVGRAGRGGQPTPTL